MKFPCMNGFFIMVLGQSWYKIYVYNSTALLKPYIDSIGKWVINSRYCNVLHHIHWLQMVSWMSAVSKCVHSEAINKYTHVKWSINKLNNCYNFQSLYMALVPSILLMKIWECPCIRVLSECVLMQSRLRCYCISQ